MGVLNQLNLDLLQCEQFAASEPVQGLNQDTLLSYFNNLREILDLLISWDWPTYFHDYGKDTSKYKKVHPDAAILLLEKLKEGDKKAMFTVLKKSERDKKRLLETVLKQLKQLSQYPPVSTLKVDDLKILKKEFSDVNEPKFALLTRKGVFPYDYVNSVERLDESKLPSIQNFYNKLNDTNISDDDYAHAQKVWESFDLKSMGEYSDLYMRTDILLLADVMENFRASSLKTYGLDPAWYYTMPCYTWDCMLKYTGCKLQIIKDIDMVMFVEQAIRGGVSALVSGGKPVVASMSNFMSTVDDFRPR
ncbi:unnamed protein product [Phaedon cochleariae]|uniref:Exocyst complex subunit EXOC6/Sec15 C-terminal domain-containing protein n=1 Tax=Phaedon cochleariae TaxID=80249 RepID=A0A9N9SKB2_PHACE|nr:unnamed protein product [Phaedon cochleariae]